MKLITESLSGHATLHGCAAALNEDVKLIEDFIGHANGCGLESLDTASGKLIESGLATRYPEHFKVGSGLEGLKDLVAKLKTGIDGLKKLGRGKAKPFVEKQTRETTEEIKKTYANKAWIDERGSTGKDVVTGDLSKAIGNFKDVTSLIAVVRAVEKTLNDAFEAHYKQTEAYIKKADVEINGVNKLRGLSDDELLKYAQEQLAIFRPLLKALAVKMPEIKGGNTSKIDTITTDEAKQLGDLMLSLIEFGKDIELRAEHLRIIGGGQEIFDQLELDEIPAEEALGDLQWNYFYWESSTEDNSDLADKIAKFCFTLVQKIESVIISALK